MLLVLRMQHLAQAPGTGVDGDRHRRAGVAAGPQPDRARRAALCSTSAPASRRRSAPARRSPDGASSVRTAPRAPLAAHPARAVRPTALRSLQSATAPSVRAPSGDRRSHRPPTILEDRVGEPRGCEHRAIDTSSADRCPPSASVHRQRAQPTQCVQQRPIGLDIGEPGEQHTGQFIGGRWWHELAACRTPPRCRR